MVPIVSLLLIITLSILITRIATVALIHTGMSREMARFQARSAFSGTGFTTTEAENVVNHPVRRRIVFTLMLLGNAGLVTSMTTLLLSLVGVRQDENPWLNLGLLVVGVGLLWLLANSSLIDRHLSRVISRLLVRYTRLEARDFDALLHLQDDYRVAELAVDEDDWIAGRTLKETRLRQEGALVLGIRRRDGSFLGAPDGSSTITAGDLLLIYGKEETVRELDTRRKGFFGDREHEQAMAEHEHVQDEELTEDEASEGSPESEAAKREREEREADGEHMEDVAESGASEGTQAAERSPRDRS